VAFATPNWNGLTREPTTPAVPLEQSPEGVVRGRRIVVAARAGAEADQVLDALKGWIDPGCLQRADCAQDPTPACCLSWKPDLLLVDTGLLEHPEQVLGPVRTHRPELPILVFGSRMDDRELVRLVCAGAHGYLNGLPDVPGIRQAVAAVLAGKIWVDQHLMAHCLATRQVIDEEMALRLHSNIEAISRWLTRREKEILCQVIKGFAIKRIAAEVHLSHQGVKLHLARLFRKFGVSTRNQLILAILDGTSPIPDLSTSLYTRLQRELLETRD
jgi:DNA-binding NarL/FixJ family response regulator